MSFARCGLKVLQKRGFSKVSNKADYKIVDHVYDAVVVGAGGSRFMHGNLLCSILKSKFLYLAFAS